MIIERNCSLKMRKLILSNLIEKLRLIRGNKIKEEKDDVERSPWVATKWVLLFRRGTKIDIVTIVEFFKISRYVGSHTIKRLWIVSSI